MIRPVLISALMTLTLPQTLFASGLELPGSAMRTFEQNQPSADYALPVGPFFEGRVESVATKGSVSRQTWRISDFGQSSLTLMTILADQLTDDGYDVLYQCQNDVCGGYDFRFSTQVVGEPHMHVDLGDFRYLSAHKPGDGDGSYVSLLVSRSPGAGYVQIIQVNSTQDAPPIETVASTKTGPATQIVASNSPIAQQLETLGHAVLSDLVFEVGSSDLDKGSFQSLANLAAFLVANPDRTVALVGHTDAQGTLDNNIALSRRRANSVMNRLVEAHNVPRAQVAANGVGYLSPLASNLTEEGRTKNRRVEVVLTTTR